MDIFVAAVIVRKRNRRRENSGKNNDFLNILKKTKTKTKNNNNSINFENCVVGYNFSGQINGYGEK
jgi:hypothetical protein